jgi:cell wall-associated NlpC family hydrolase
VTGAESEAAARLLERLLTDPAFRQYFRRYPVVASREAGLAGVAEEMAMSAGKAMETLDDRESRSSLAGVFMAAALEGAGIYDFSGGLVPHLEGIPKQVEDVLSRVHGHGGLTTPAGLADVGAPGAGAVLAEAPPAPPNAAGEFAAITPEQADWKPPEQDAAPVSGPAGAEAPPADAETDGAAPPEEAAPNGEAAPPEPGGPEDPGGGTDAEADGDSGGDDDDDESDEEEDDDGSDGEQPDADDGSSGDGSEGGGSDGDHDDNSDGIAGSGGEGGGHDDNSDGTAASGGEGRGEDAETADTSDGGDSAQVDLGDAGGAYPGDSAPPAETAAWMGSEAQKRGLPPELPVMAALVESSMHNLDRGDADSLGYFQMRSSVWNQGAYAGYAGKAELQLKWFLDQADAVKRQRMAAGRPVDDPSGYGEWIADVERPRAEYRGRYQLRLDEARELLRHGGRGDHHPESSGADVAVDAVGDHGDDSAGPRALAAVAEAKKYLGTPYQWGGSSPKTGFDCSGLMQWAYAKAGIQIPRTSEQQILASNGTPVDRAHLEPGDLVFFRNAGGDVHHVGVSLGGDKFINAPHTGARVRIDDLNQSYYAREFAGGRRFDVAADGAPRPDAVDAQAARRAEAALARDAAEAQRPGTLLFEAVKAQELRKLEHTRALRAVDPTAAP